MFKQKRIRRKLYVITIATTVEKKKLQMLILIEINSKNNTSTHWCDFVMSNISEKKTHCRTQKNTSFTKCMDDERERTKMKM